MTLFHDTFNPKEAFSWEIREYYLPSPSKKGEWEFEFNYRYNKEEYVLKIPTTQDGGSVLHKSQEEWIQQVEPGLVGEWYGYFNSYRIDFLERIEDEIIHEGGYCKVRKGEISEHVLFPLQRKIYNRMEFDYKRYHPDGEIILRVEFDFISNSCKLKISGKGGLDIEDFMETAKSFLPKDGNKIAENNLIILTGIDISVLYEFSKILPERKFVFTNFNLYPRNKNSAI
ncbi:MAG: hypothetical protein JXA60_09665 [Candidatus Coatesbacteria bacterium]|nr:hypothetical protein [Candidatus Coatesbacteria bacterium]